MMTLKILNLWWSSYTRDFHSEDLQDLHGNPLTHTHNTALQTGFTGVLTQRHPQPHSLHATTPGAET
ncbi:unnamed protein product [Pleuronectes platessa]|uniref:Uncharacterized protein n=1 Tax=Pleuronectes platessa TaxID=8262 RepID=A0A9N7U7X5_PLEPL|nr:unnamed protein product [Pleuronectes platessa]